ncbi:hypothetical protein [Geobacter sp. AOG2]|uniref:hypothetical protein n=1 Tax=Geobacter sp. AOG2 TaxID=1566347 RepID=UPI001CC6AC9D|nr:hypothetical protein [Geobacter sp. AOG2]GFE60354.1 hypothetical protein AOG2_09420 [Geobacter sp. AOG2]
MFLSINSQRLQTLIEEPFILPSPRELRRWGAVFFIGGDLPVFETLETMYESHCQEATGLFHVTFSGRSELRANLELVRQIKKNFSVRLMGRINAALPEAHFEQLYLAGLDILDIPLRAFGDAERSASHDQLPYFARAAAVFPHWSLISSLTTNEMTAPELRSTIDAVLNNGIVPLLTMAPGTNGRGRDEITALFAYLSDAWHRHEVALKPLLPLIHVSTPLESSESSGLLRNAIGRFHDRRTLVTGNLLRHLRTSGAEASFESAGL